MHLILFFLLISHAVCVEKTENDTFQATKDWQPIKDGMKVPSGLHYRINLETGVKEAKLLDDDNSNILDKGSKGQHSSLSILKPPAESNATQPTNKTASPLSAAHTNIEEALKNIPAEIYEYSKDEMDEIKSKFRTYDEIKEQLKEVNLNVRTDAEIMKKLITEYEELMTDITSEQLTKKQSEVERILEDLEYLVHQVDNALEFLDQGGLEKVILPNLNRTNNSVLKIKSLNLLGSALQNNPKAQVTAYDKGLAEHLIRFLSTTKIETEINSCLFAFGSLVRHFPVAQKHVLSKSVINVLFGIWTKEVHLKIKVKVLTFLTDLLMEAEEAKKEGELAGELATRVVEKWKQYESVNLEKLLIEFEYCKKVEQFVIAEKPALISNPEQTERIISSLNYSTRLCKETWSEDPELRHVILVLKNRYGDQVQEGTGENVEHLKEILGDIEGLYSVLFQYLKDKVQKEEL